MKTMLIAGLAMLVPALAQSPDDLITQLKLELQPRAAERLFVIGGATVKNAPYSADAVTETTQSLTDGNRIVQRTTQKLYRDSDGRERREESVLAAGALAQADMPHVITISDPVEKVSYTLDPQQRTARRNTGPVWFAKVAPTVNLYFRDLGVVNGGWSSVQTPGATEHLKEDLGSKSIEGVIAQGTRNTETIPAGQIGNQLPIKVVDEVWHSAELQMDVMTTHSDPRSGEIVYKLTNINRANPPRSLFEPPADYTITGAAVGAAGAGGRGRGAAPGAQK
jgi:hypothetical protein